MKHRTFAVALGLATTFAVSLAPSASAQTVDDAGAPIVPTPSSEALPVLPTPPEPAPGPADAATAAPPVSIAESDRGGRGESCRARADCKAGLGCFDNRCRAACGVDSDCEDGNACNQGVCEAPSNENPRPTTIELDETFTSRTVTGYNYNGYGGYGSYGGYGYPDPTVVTEAVASSIFDLRHRLKSTELVVTIPFGIETDSIGSGTFAAGNVALSAYFTRRNDALRFRVGGSLVLPTGGTSGRGPIIEAAAAASRGWDRIWLWAPQYGAIAADVLVGSNERDVFQHATELVLAPMMPFGAPSEKAAFIAQLSEDVGAHVGSFRYGLRGEIVTATLYTTNVQVSALPYVGIDKPGGFFDIGFRLNLSEPAGFSFDESKYWGLRFHAGVRF